MVASVLVVLAAFIAGQRFAGGSADGGGAAPSVSSGRPLGTAPDISNMSPQEAASRLFDRVMRYSTEGKADSAALFAPMAILAYERVGPLDAHARYDVGTISVAIGDAAAAAAQADTILRQNPSHLLGLILAAKAAELAKDPAGVGRFRSRLAAAASAERAKGLSEYTDHQRDIDDALKAAGTAAGTAR